MSKPEIYFVNDYGTFEISEGEAKDRGYRYFYVKINDDIYYISAYNPVRLCQDFDSEMKSYGYYSVDPNLILIESVTTENLIFTVNKLHEGGYFDHLKPLKQFDREATEDEIVTFLRVTVKKEYEVMGLLDNYKESVQYIKKIT